MNQIKLRVNGKLNLSLNVDANAEGGFHNLQSVMMSVDIRDVIIIDKRNDKRVFVSMNIHKVMENNTALIAGKLMTVAYDLDGADIFVHKTIPLMGGMGGSSADAAGVIMGLQRMYGLSIDKKLFDIADSIGSDVKFMLRGGLGEVSGRGDKIKFIPNDNEYHFVVIKPSFGLNTAKVFAHYDIIGCEQKADNSQLVNAITNGHLSLLADNISNNLMPTAMELMPALKGIYETVASFNPLALSMTGSGSCLFALCANYEESVLLASNLRERGIYAKYCVSKKKGVEFF